MKWEIGDSLLNPWPVNWEDVHLWAAYLEEAIENWLEQLNEPEETL